MKCSVYVATSVDGFIAGTDGDIDWLMRPEYAVSLLNGLSFEEFIADVDALVMGRRATAAPHHHNTFRQCRNVTPSVRRIARHKRSATEGDAQRGQRQ